MFFSRSLLSATIACHLFHGSQATVLPLQPASDSSSEMAKRDIYNGKPKSKPSTTSEEPQTDCILTSPITRQHRSLLPPRAPPSRRWRILARHRRLRRQNIHRFPLLELHPRRIRQDNRVRGRRCALCGCQLLGPASERDFRGRTVGV